MADPRPIGIFDSGIGGLTVLRAIHKLAPDESLIYLGDTARVPYGSKSKDTVLKYTINNLKFLESQGVKMVVVACNTASAHALPELLANHEGPPLIGVIEGGVKAALASGPGAIGIIGTEATINSGAYQRAITQASQGRVVLAKSCPMFVPLVEEGWTANRIANDIANEYLEEFKGKVGSLVLGCTHYPLLKDTIAQTMGPGIQLVDSAEQTALLVRETLLSKGLERNDPQHRASIKFYVTDSPQRSMEVARRMLGEVDIDEAVLVDIAF